MKAHYLAEMQDGELFYLVATNLLSASIPPFVKEHPVLWTIPQDNAKIAIIFY
jgi:hypothetical protein